MRSSHLRSDCDSQRRAGQARLNASSGSSQLHRAAWSRTCRPELQHQEGEACGAALGSLTLERGKPHVWRHHTWMSNHGGVLPAALRSALRLDAPPDLQEGWSGGVTDGRSADLQTRPNDEARLPGERIFSHGSCPQADGDCNGECPQATEIVSNGECRWACMHAYSDEGTAADT